MKTILVLTSLLSLQAFALDLTVDITNIKTVEGTIKMVIFPPDAGFPGQYENAVDTAIVDVTSFEVSHTFKNLQSGSYAVAVFHDVNNNDDLDTNRLRIPVEPFGFSNNPSLLGPPTFKKCKFKLDQDLSLSIGLRKIL